MRLDQGGVGDVWLGYRPEGVVLRAWRFAVIPDESELVDLYGFAVGDLAGFGPGGLGAFADGDHEGYQVGVGEVDDFGDGLEIKSVHGDAVVAFGFGGEHEGGAIFKRSINHHQLTTWPWASLTAKTPRLLATWAAMQGRRDWWRLPKPKRRA